MPNWTAKTATSRAEGTAETLADAWSMAHAAAAELARAGGRCPVVLAVDENESVINGPTDAAGEQLAAFIESGRDEIVAAYR